MHRILYNIIYGILWIITLLPLKVLYVISDLCFVIIYCIIPYRKKVVFQNLQNSFPNKTENEIHKIARSFYHYFVDFIFENIKSINFLYRNQKKRFVFKNIELINNLYELDKNIVLVSGHYGNWEWMNIFPLFIKHKFYYAAKILHTSFTDKIINNLRQKYGAIFVQMEDTYRRVIKEIKKGDKILIWLLADQRPPKRADYWITFLNQDTSFFLGAGKIVKKLGFSLVFMDIQRTGRGKYEITFDLLAEPTTDLDEYQLTELHVRKLEEIINKKPDYWLWSHKRWKHKRPQPNI